MRRSEEAVSPVVLDCVRERSHIARRFIGFSPTTIFSYLLSATPLLKSTS